MKKLIYLSIILSISLTISEAQSTAMQFNGLDCNGNMVDLFADLNAGKAVVLHFYMPNCGSCPPPAQKIQAMANKINNVYPGMVKGYAFPFQNSTTCAYSSSWVSVNGLSDIYQPMDSGALQVAYYGGFGMPTVVLLGGTDHRVMFVTQSFTSSDTTIMRDSILALLSSTTGTNNFTETVSSVNIFQTPGNNVLHIDLNVIHNSNINIDLVNSIGELVSPVYVGNSVSGLLEKEISISNLKSGIYFVRMTVGSRTWSQKFVKN